MVFCDSDCRCQHCYLIKVYQHPRFKKDIENMIEIYKLMENPNYFPIDINIIHKKEK